MINCVVRSGEFLQIFKLTRIVPISKPGKPLDQIDSYRPVNNLCTLEKILEAWINKCMIEWAETNNLISEKHHGGRKGYSTNTAIANIQNTIDENINGKCFNILLQTDLSTAFDMIDHKVLLGKLEHYGVRGKELRLFNSFLSNQTQMVEIDTFRSTPLECPAMSCIQGSISVNTLFSIYTNEVPHLDTVLQCPHTLASLLTPSPCYTCIRTINPLDRKPDKLTKLMCNLTQTIKQTLTSRLTSESKGGVGRGMREGHGGY